jgi:oxygen-independent coproporphyrinogen-3 oxidase
MDTTADFDLELVRRYDKAGPRYTSYPTAPQFKAGFPLERYLDEIESSNGDPLPAPLSIYVHLPFCTNPCFYCGCTRIITRDEKRGVEYLGLVEREIALQAERFDADRPVEQLHLGGGSPNFYAPEALGQLVETIGRQFRLAAPESREFGIEIDPRLVNVQQLRELRAIGFNRVSFGVQDFDPAVQQAVNRRQGVEATLELITASRELGFRSINADLIYGLPKQTAAGFDTTLTHIIGARPDRIAAYSYAHLPERFKAQRRIDEADLPSPAAKLRLLAQIVERLTGAGYRYIGMDHFALPEDELSRALDNGGLQRNFQGYSTHAHCDLIGIGMSSIGEVGDVYVQNRRALPLYQDALNHGELAIDRGLVMDEDDRLRRCVISKIMCQGVLDFKAVEERYQIHFGRRFAASLARLAPLAADGLVELDNRQLRVTPRGRYLLRSIAMCFDAYLHAERSNHVAEPVRYSRVI